MTEPFKWIKSHLERLSYKWTPRTKALQLARRPSQLADKRVKYQYQCNHCKVWFKAKEIQVDHVQPKGAYTKEKFFTWLDRLFCDTSGFQILCILCHAKKSATEKSDGSYK